MKKFLAVVALVGATLVLSSQSAEAGGCRVVRCNPGPVRCAARNVVWRVTHPFQSSACRPCKVVRTCQPVVSSCCGTTTTSTAVRTYPAPTTAAPSAPPVLPKAPVESP